MLKLSVKDGETTVELEFEHSLRTLSKWESKHKKAWFDTGVKANEELIDYFGFMLQTPGYEPTIVYRLSPDQLDDLAKYINDPMTSTVVPALEEKGGSRDRMTTELVYYWMTALKINWEAQDWHFNRLMVLISLTNFKQQPEKKQHPGKLLKTWDQINSYNKKKFGTTG